MVCGALPTPAYETVGCAYSGRRSNHSLYLIRYGGFAPCRNSPGRGQGITCSRTYARTISFCKNFIFTISVDAVSYVDSLVLIDFVSGRVSSAALEVPLVSKEPRRGGWHCSCPSCCTSGLENEIKEREENETNKIDDRKDPDPTHARRDARQLNGFRRLRGIQPHVKSPTVLSQDFGTRKPG